MDPEKSGTRPSPRKGGCVFILLLLLFWAGNGYLRPLPLDRMERLIFDWNLSGASPEGEPPRIILITAGESSLEELGRWPWPRDRHAALVDRLRLADVVLVDILFPEHGDPDQDRSLARSVETHGRVVLAEHLIADPANGSYRIIPPFPALSRANLSGGYTNMETDIDGMVRYFNPVKRIGTQLLPSFPIAGLSAVTGQAPRLESDARGKQGLRLGPHILQLDEEGRVWIDYSAPVFPRYEYRDVLNGRISPEIFDGKIVLVGVKASGIEDFFNIPTPFGRQEVAGVQLNAEIIHMALNGRGIVRTPRATDAAIVLVWAMIGYLLGKWASPRRGWLLMMAAFGVMAAAIRCLFVTQGIWITASTPALAFTSLYFVMVVRRFVFSSNELAIRHYSMATIHDLLIPRDHSTTYEAYLEAAWPKIAARTGIHLLRTKTSLNGMGGEMPPPRQEASSEDRGLILLRGAGRPFPYRLYIPLPAQGAPADPQYTLLGWRKSVPEGRVQSIASVVLASSWYFSLLEESRARKKMLISAIDAIAAAVDAKDSQTGGHSRRVAQISMEIAGQLELSEEIQDDIYLGALIHDIGKIGIPDAVLTKKGRLTDPEMDLIRTHPEIGRKIMEAVDLPILTAQAIQQHHERCDGNGYPGRLSEEEITLAGKIVAVADVFDAMTQKRYYKDGIPAAEVLDHLNRQKGKQFDARVVDALIRLRAPLGWQPGPEAPDPASANAPPQRASRTGFDHSTLR